MNHERYYLLTGAAGFPGTNICSREGETVEETKKRLSRK
jgi:hypothetical protein